VGDAVGDVVGAMEGGEEGSFVGVAVGAGTVVSQFLPVHPSAHSHSPAP